MSEELYAPIPDVNAYLARIGIAEAKEPTVSFLDEIIDALTAEERAKKLSEGA